MDLKRWAMRRTPHGLRRALRNLWEELTIFMRHRKGIHDARKFADSKGLKLNIGCGRNIKKGWINIDLSKEADLQLDMRELLPLADGSVREIYSEHFFEHLDYPDDAKRFLGECFRVLETGGVFSLGVPDTRWPLLDYADVGDGQYFQAAERLEWHPEWCKTRLDHINYHFRQNNEHRFAYDFETMENALKDSGFVEIRQREFHPNYDTKSRALGTLYVDALKP